MAWNSDKAKYQYYSTSYIDKETLAAAEKNIYIKTVSTLLMDKAISLMKMLKEKGVNLTLKRRDGTTYQSKAVVSVKQATSYDREVRKEIPLYRKDGSVIMSLSIAIKTSTDETIILYAKENISRGIIIQNMTLKTWENGKPRLYKLEEIKADNTQCTPITKAAMKAIISQNIIQKKSNKSDMENLTAEINRLFASTSDKVPSTNPDDTGNYRLVNNAYAQYVNNDFGEKCMLRSHSDNIVIEMGVTENGSKYVKATNFDKPVNTPDGTRYESIFINNPSDLENLNNKAIIQVIAAYKKIELPKD